MNVFTFLRCKVFNRNKFLTETKLTQDMLPILSVYLENDFIKRVNVPQFCRYLRLRRRYCVANVINWLTTKNITEAIEKMLNFYKNE